ncbi:MAG: hypothetical protein DMG95_07600 [Acidobacteria bacterium]|nr:MAG: hypothetical protein DMG95_07600 [Acidobacteriota bacterium]
MPKEALYACQLSGVSPSLANSVSFFSVRRSGEVWDDGTRTTTAERDAIRARLAAALDFLGVKHTVHLS